MMLKRLFSLGMLSCGLAFCMPVLSLTLTLKPTVTLQYANVTLANVAALEDLPNPAVAKALLKLPLAATPKPGQSIVLTRQTITTRIRHAYPALLPILKWQGAESVTIFSDAKALDSSHLQSLAEQNRRNALENKVSTLDLQLSEPIVSLVPPEGEVKIVARPLNENVVRKRMRVWLDITVGDHYRRALPVWFTVTAMTQVSVAKVNVMAGDPLDKRQFEHKLVDIAGLPRAPLPYAAEIEKMRSKRPIAIGAVLSHDDMEAQPPISRFQEVAVRLITKGIVLETSGTALNDGTLGKTIRIKNNRSGKEFLAVVVAPGTANIVTR